MTNAYQVIDNIAPESPAPIAPQLRLVGHGFQSACDEVTAQKPIMIGGIVYSAESIARIADPFERELVSLHPVVFKFSMSLYRNRVAAEDLTQTVMRKAIKNRDSFEMGTNMKAWLFKTTRNAFYSEIRKKSNQEIPVGEFFDENAISIKESQEDALIIKDIVLNAMPSLSEEQAQTVGMMVFMGMSDDEAAKVLNCSPITIRTRLHRARDRIVSITETDAGVPTQLKAHMPKNEFSQKLGRFLFGNRL